MLPATRDAQELQNNMPAIAHKDQRLPPIPLEVLRAARGRIYTLDGFTLPGDLRVCSRPTRREGEALADLGIPVATVVGRLGGRFTTTRTGPRPGFSSPIRCAAARDRSIMRRLGSA